jgi:transcription antitermination factor NusG
MTITRPPHIYPEDLFDRATLGGEGSDAHRSWWLLHTKSRQEKKVAEALLAQQAPFYLPLIETKSVAGGRSRNVWMPLFRGYVFLWGRAEERLLALKTNRLAAVHPVANGARLCRDLAGFAELIAKGARLTPEAQIVAGQRVRVKSGAFAGHEGVVIKRRGKTKLLVVLEALLQGASLDVEDHLLEAV